MLCFYIFNKCVVMSLLLRALKWLLISLKVKAKILVMSSLARHSLFLYPHSIPLASLTVSFTVPHSHCFSRSCLLAVPGTFRAHFCLTAFALFHSALNSVLWPPSCLQICMADSLTVFKLCFLTTLLKLYPIPIHDSPMPFFHSTYFPLIMI